MKKLPKGSYSVLIGALLGMAVVIGLGNQIVHSAYTGQQGKIRERQATIQAMTLAALVESARSTQEMLPRIIRQYQQRNHQIDEIRILQLSGARLLASSQLADIGQEGKRLARSEKAFFDLAKSLKVGIQTNRDEGVYRKKELDLTSLTMGGILVTVPYLSNEEMLGVVQMRVGSRHQAAYVGNTIGWLLLLVVLALAVPLLHSLGKVTSKGAYKTVAVLLPVLLAMMAMLTIKQKNTFSQDRHGTEQRLANHYLAAIQNARNVALIEAIPFQTPTTNNWDCDSYRRPFRFFDNSGQLNLPLINTDLAAKERPLNRVLWSINLLGLVLFLSIGLGGVARLWQIFLRHRLAYSYVAPAMIGMIILIFFPLLYGLALSFTGQTLYNTDQSLFEIWVGLDNYLDVIADWHVLQHGPEGWRINYENFYWTAFITTAWTLCNVAIGVSLGLGLALVLNMKGLAFKPLYRAILVLPWALPTYVTALIWKGLFHKQFGPINQVIQIFGGEAIAWFDNVFTAFLTGITVNGWLSFPFMMLISLGGLQSISPDMYEAADLDGASRFQKFRYITLPSLKPTLIPAIIISVIWTFNLFNVIYLVSAGEPGGANEILVTKAYKIAFEKYQYGYAAAYATVIFVILLSYGIFQNKLSKATEDIRK